MAIRLLPHDLGRCGDVREPARPRLAVALAPRHNPGAASGEARAGRGGDPGPGNGNAPAPVHRARGTAGSPGCAGAGGRHGVVRASVAAAARQPSGLERGGVALRRGASADGFCRRLLRRQRPGASRRTSRTGPRLPCGTATGSTGALCVGAGSLVGGAACREAAPRRAAGPGAGSRAAADDRPARDKTRRCGRPAVRAARGLGPSGVAPTTPACLPPAAAPRRPLQQVPGGVLTASTLRQHRPDVPGGSGAWSVPHGLRRRLPERSKPLTATRRLNGNGRLSNNLLTPGGGNTALLSDVPRSRGQPASATTVRARPAL
jgi:hypothetical protein